MFKEKFVTELKKFWNDEEAQGMMEYILMAVAVVGIAMVVGPQLKDLVVGKTDDLGQSMDGFTSEGL